MEIEITSAELLAIRRELRDDREREQLDAARAILAKIEGKGEL